MHFSKSEIYSALVLCTFVVLSRAHVYKKVPEPEVNHTRNRRYLGLNKRFKINKRFQECVAFGDSPGHCKHISFCPLDIIGTLQGSKSLEYLCIIDKIHVGVCCPDDILTDKVSGSQVVVDLPAGGYDYADEAQEESASGCGLIHVENAHEKKPNRFWPWITAIYRTDKPIPFCGGVIITDKHILTAAHCTHGLKAAQMKVRLGENDVTITSESRTVEIAVKDIIEHEEFYLPTYNNDIAILVLEKPATFTTYIWPVCLPPVNRSYVNETAYVAGWGQQYFGGPVSSKLKEIAVPVWDYEACKNAFSDGINEKNLCAAGYEGGRDSCTGDSGGPLLYQLENSRWVTIGIVSWGIGCGNPGQPGVYTKVDHFIAWIIKHTLT